MYVFAFPDWVATPTRYSLVLGLIVVVKEDICGNAGSFAVMSVSPTVARVTVELQASVAALLDTA